MNTLVGPLPRHVYCHVERHFLRRPRTPPHPEPYERVVWFGLVSHPGRAFGCTVMTEEGAVYRNLPPHALVMAPEGAPVEPWDVHAAQRWNCYGPGFTTLVYPYLDGLRCRAKVRGRGNDVWGTYLFTAAPVGDAFSEAPEQAKEFSFVRLDNGRLTIQPTDTVLFEELSFTRRGSLWPTDLKRQTETFKVTE